MKRLLSVILAVVLTASVLTMGVYADEIKIISAKPEINFSDVDKDSNAGKAIYKLANAGILVGDGDGTFRPDDPISRAELAKIVNALFNYTEKDTTGFSDVTPDKWYYDYVLIAKKAGYIVGYDDGTFKGDARVTREQACAILCRVAKLFDVSEDVEIKDAVSEWAIPYVQKVIGNMFMSLESGNTFRAQANITRAEFSVVYANFVQDTPSESEKPSADDKPSGGSIPSGGGTGGSGGGGTGGNGGNTTPGEPEINYGKVNYEILTNLRNVSTDITNNIGRFTEVQFVSMLNTINQCIKKVIADGSSTIINREYLAKTYPADISNAKGYLAAIKADPALKAKFTEEAGTNLSVPTIEWLLNAFDVDMSDLMK